MTNVFYFKINLNKFGEQRLMHERERENIPQCHYSIRSWNFIVLAGWFYVLGNTKEKLENRKAYLAETNKSFNAIKPAEITFLQTILTVLPRPSQIVYLGKEDGGTGSRD